MRTALVASACLFLLVALAACPSSESKPAPVASPVSGYVGELSELGNGYAVNVNWAEHPRIKYGLLGPRRGGLHEYTFSVDGVELVHGNTADDFKVDGDFKLPTSVYAMTAKEAKLEITDDKGKKNTWVYHFDTRFIDYPADLQPNAYGFEGER